MEYQAFLPPELRCEGDRVPREEFWAHGDMRVHLDRHVDEQAPRKLVALPGAGGHGRLIASVGLAASGIAETVAPDLPGYGHTELGARRAYTYHDWVEVVADLVASEQPRDGRPVVLFGASMGGMLAYNAAVRSPAVRGVIATNLLDPRDRRVRRAVVRHPSLASGVPLLFPLATVAGRVRVPVRALANMRAIANDPELAAACARDPVGGGDAVPLSFLASWLGSRREVPPERFDRPILLVHPGDDRWTPPNVSQAFLRRLRGATRLRPPPRLRPLSSRRAGGAHDGRGDPRLPRGGHPGGPTSAMTAPGQRERRPGPGLPRVRPPRSGSDSRSASVGAEEDLDAGACPGLDRRGRGRVRFEEGPIE
ncbi:alpha/beta hydrolase [Egibacter rhizosphaerae]|uniref:Alpha/beta hydrolase n=1 Tax=Egibacter rhizosphaerae TaxID=1670831 RepID=A0A411YFK2_9ACTN|nr:alpha/beta hydrolase [Egibacter rhizosphaerae]QBI19887.1 alpha/beta hydrolase [Egibacter rhizosphaerae]